jgi:hypothetical protein
MLWALKKCRMRFVVKRVIDEYTTRPALAKGKVITS